MRHTPSCLRAAGKLRLCRPLHRPHGLYVYWYHNNSLKRTNKCCPHGHLKVKPSGIRTISWFCAARAVRDPCMAGLHRWREASARRAMARKTSRGTCLCGRACNGFIPSRACKGSFSTQGSASGGAVSSPLPRHAAPRLRQIRTWVASKTATGRAQREQNKHFTVDDHSPADADGARLHTASNRQRRASASPPAGLPGRVASLKANTSRCAQAFAPAAKRCRNKAAIMAPA